VKVGFIDWHDLLEQPPGVIRNSVSLVSTEMGLDRGMDLVRKFA